MAGQRPSEAGPSDAPARLGRLAEIEEQTQKLRGDLEAAERRAREDEEREKQQPAWREGVETATRDLPARRAAQLDAERRQSSITGELAATLEALTSADKDARKDLTVRQQKLSDDRTRLGKEITRLGGEIAELEQRAAEPFVFLPPRSAAPRTAPSAGRFVPPTSARLAPVVPEEALPQAGLLRSHRGQRYLVIHTWEELAAGEHAAARLSAQLVAPEKP